MMLHTDSSDTQERIIQYLRQHRASTVPELSRILGSTRANIRYHIRKLIQKGLLSENQAAVHAGAIRGRPIHEYRLSTDGYENNLPNLCSGLLNVLMHQQKTGENSLDLMGEIARWMVPASPKDQPLTYRLSAAVSELSQMNYRARWEASGSGPRVIFQNCPYAMLVGSHPELCLMDEVLLEQLLHIRLRLIQQASFTGAKPKVCIFESSQPTAPENQS